MLRPSRPMIRPFMSSADKLDDRDRRLGRVAGGEPLHTDREDVAHAALRLALGLLLDLPDPARRIVARLFLDLCEQQLLGLGAGHPRELLERPLHLAAAVGELGALLLELGLPTSQHLLALGDRVGPPVQAGVALGQRCLQGSRRFAFDRRSRAAAAPCGRP